MPLMPAAAIRRGRKGMPEGSPISCQGCSSPTTKSFQCPLCGAEGATDRGFFCSQECFAKHWIQHRDTCHRSGVVREKKKKTTETTAAAPPENAESKTAGRMPAQAKGQKRSRAEAAAVSNGKTASVDGCPSQRWHQPWPALPSYDTCQQKGWALLSPSLDLAAPRAVVSTSSTETEFMWPSMVAAAQYIALSLRHEPDLQVLVAAGDVYSAHAFAWAARCAGLTGLLRMAVAPTDEEELCTTPSLHFSPGRKVVVATAAVLRDDRVVDASGVASLWLAGGKGLLVTLPDVEEAADLQGVSTRAVFFVRPTAAKTTAEGESITHRTAAIPLQNDDGSPLHWQPVSVPGPSLRLDNRLSTCFANGDLKGSLQELVRVFSCTPGHLESVLLSTLICNWGAAGGVHAHHRLAYVARYLVDHAERFQSKRNAGLADAALRAIVVVAGLLPPLSVTAQPAAATPAAKASKTKKGQAATTEQSSPAAAVVMRVEGASPPSALELQRFPNYYSTAPNIQLQATICHIFDAASPATLDALAAAWGLTDYLAGPSSLQAANAARVALVTRIQGRMRAKLDKNSGVFYVILMHLLYDCVATYSLTTAEVQERLLWDLTLAHDAGPLPAFLSSCDLIGDKPTTAAAARAKKSATAMSSRKSSLRESAASRTELLRCLAVRAPDAARFVELPWKRFPITGERQRSVARLQQAAVEEILMAMPRIPRPLFIGDVGNLIGKWQHFNGRFDGALGVSLQDFLLQHPESFKIVGTLVTRRSAGKTEQVRIRFDDHDDDDDDDDEGGHSKRRDRELLTGAGKRGKKAEKDLPARARKRQAVREFNKARFNRNYKQVDPSARVPGYIKRGPRRITGRGKKPNKRVVKRG